MKSKLNVGIDLGRTIVSRDEKYNPFQDSFSVIKRIIEDYNEVYIVSRVNSEQKKSAEAWLENNNFYNETGFKRKNLYFCFERADKAIFAKALEIDVFIDDRPDVLIPMKTTNEKILFNPSKMDLLNFREAISLENLKVMENWAEIGKLLL